MATKSGIYWQNFQRPTAQVEAAESGGEALPSLHSDRYYPVVEPSIRTGVLTMCSAVLNLVGK